MKSSVRNVVWIVEYRFNSSKWTPLAMWLIRDHARDDMKSRKSADLPECSYRIVKYESTKDSI